MGIFAALQVVVYKRGNGIKKSSVYAGLRAWFHVLEGLGTWDAAAISPLLFSPAAF